MGNVPERTLSPFTGKPGWTEGKNEKGHVIGKCSETDAVILAEDDEGMQIAYDLAVARREGQGEVGPAVLTS